MIVSLCILWTKFKSKPFVTSMLDDISACFLADDPWICQMWIFFSKAVYFFVIIFSSSLFLRLSRTFNVASIPLQTSFSLMNHCVLLFLFLLALGWMTSQPTNFQHSTREAPSPECIYSRALESGSEHLDFSNAHCPSLLHLTCHIPPYQCVWVLVSFCGQLETRDKGALVWWQRLRQLLQVSSTAGNVSSHISTRHKGSNFKF